MQSFWNEENNSCAQPTVEIMLSELKRHMVHLGRVRGNTIIMYYTMNASNWRNKTRYQVTELGIIINPLYKERRIMLESL